MEVVRGIIGPESRAGSPEAIGAPCSAPLSPFQPPWASLNAASTTSG